MNTAMVIAKEVAKAASNFGIGYVTGAIANTFTPENANTIVKVCVYIGSTAAAGAVAVKANEYIDETAEAIDKSVKEIKKVVEKTKSQKEEVIEETPEKEEKPKKTKKKTTKKKETIEEPEEKTE